MTFATLNGDRVAHALVRCPARGVWIADVSTTRATTPTGAATLTIGGLVLVGTILAGSTFAGATSVRVVGGAGGWRSDVRARAYRSDLGVPRSLVLAELAADAREALAPAPSDTRLGAAWVRQAGPAGDALRLVWGPEWYVADAGGTVLGARLPTPVVVPYRVLHERPEHGLLTLATEAPEGIRPGMLLGARRLGTVTLELGTALRLTVWTP